MLRKLYDSSIQVNAISQPEAPRSFAIVVPIQNCKQLMRANPTLCAKVRVASMQELRGSSVACQDHFLQIYLSQRSGFIDVAPGIGAARRIVNEKESAIRSPRNTQTSIIFFNKSPMIRSRFLNPKLSLLTIIRTFKNQAPLSIRGRNATNWSVRQTDDWRTRRLGLAWHRDSRIGYK